MKRTLSLLLALVLCLSLCSCAFDEDYLDSNGLDSSQHNETDATEEIHVHHWNDATCKTPKTCSSCGATDGDILPHSWKNATCTSPKKCTACGDTEGNPLSHFWIDPTCTTPKTCSSCGKTTGSSTGHTYNNGKCTVCGKADPTDPNNIKVWVPTNGGTKYHLNSGCSNMKNPKQITLASARASGFTACKKCA